MLGEDRCRDRASLAPEGHEGVADALMELGSSTSRQRRLDRLPEEVMGESPAGHAGVARHEHARCYREVELVEDVTDWLLVRARHQG